MFCETRIISKWPLGCAVSCSSIGARESNRSAIFGPASARRKGKLHISRMVSVWHLSTLIVIFILPVESLTDTFADALIREVLSRMEGPEDSLRGPSLMDYGMDYNPAREEQQNDVSKAFEARRDAILNREPSIRDEEYLEHSSLFGNKYVSGGAGEGSQRLKPNGSIKNLQVVKTDGALPAFCNPPNPCPLGYSAEDGCLENFVNTAAFSREYQSSQQCMCDSEHMFDCPGSTRENEIDALARTFENEGLAEVALDRLMKTMEPLNPYLEGEKLPVVAKKGQRSPAK